MATNRGLWAVIRRYQTLMLFGVLMGCSSAFVACGSDDEDTPTGGRGGTAGRGGTSGRGGTAGTSDSPSTNDATRTLEEEEEAEDEPAE